MQSSRHLYILAWFGTMNNLSKSTFLAHSFQTSLTNLAQRTFVDTPLEMLLHRPLFLNGFINTGTASGVFRSLFAFPVKVGAPLYDSSTPVPTRTTPVYYTSATASTRGLIHYFLVSVFIGVNALSLFNVVILCLMFQPISRPSVVLSLPNAPPIDALMILYNIPGSIFRRLISVMKASTISYKILVTLGLLSGSRWIIAGVLLIVGLNPYLPSKKSIRKCVTSSTFARPLAYLFLPPVISDVEAKAELSTMVRCELQITGVCLFAFDSLFRNGRSKHSKGPFIKDDCAPVSLLYSLLSLQALVCFCGP